MNISSQRKIGSVLGYVYTLCQAIISVIYIPILLHGIGDSEYGLYQIISSIVAYFAAMEAPLSAALLKYYSLYKENHDNEKMENTLAMGEKVFKIISIIFLVVSIPTVCIFKKIYAKSLSQNEQNEAVMMFGIMIVNLIINLNGYTYVAAITAQESFVFLKISSLISLILQPILVVMIIKKLPYAFVLVALSTFFSFILYWVRRYYAKYKLGIVFKYHGRDKALMAGIIKLSLSVLFVAIADQIFWKTDQLILGAMYDTKIVSIYSIGAQFNSMFISIACVIGGMTLPMVTKISKENNRDDKLSEIFAKIGRYQAFIVYLLLTGVILYGKEFIIILSGEEYLEAYYVALLLMIPYSVDLIQICAGSIMQVKDKYFLRSITLFVIAMLNIFLTIVLTRLKGIIGAAMATAISIMVSNIMLNIFYKRIINLNIGLFWEKCMPIIVASLILSGVGYLISLIQINNIYFAFLIHVILYAFIYVSTMLVFVMKKHEKELVRSVVHKLCRKI